MGVVGWQLRWRGARHFGSDRRIANFVTRAGRGDVAGMEAYIKAGEVAGVAVAEAATGATALHYAAQQGQAAAVDFLLSRGAQVNAADHAGRTALHVTSDAAIARALLGAGADKTATDDTGATAYGFILQAKLEPAAFREHIERRREILQSLLDDDDSGARMLDRRAVAKRTLAEMESAASAASCDSSPRSFPFY